MSGPRDDVSIYEHIRAHVPSDGPGLSEGGDRLLDETDPEDGIPSFGSAPGFLDQVVDPGSAIDSERVAARSFRLLEAAVRNPSSNERNEELYKDLRANDPDDEVRTRARELLSKGRRVSMNIGEQRRTIYIEPIEEPESSPLNEPSPGVQPVPADPDLSPEMEPALPA